MSVEDYEVLKVLSKNSIYKTYKTKYKNTNELFVWNALEYDHLDKTSRDSLKDKILARIGLQHPNILEFQNPIKEEKSKTYYLVTTYCKNGSLKDMIRFSLKNNKCLSEEFICKILYQVAFAIKTIDQYAGKLLPREIFFDGDFNVKLYNFELDADSNTTKPKMSMLGELLFKCCSLEENTKDFEKKLKKLNKLYSKKLLLLIISMMRDNGDLKENIDEILCHPTVLLNSAKWSKTRCFMQINANIAHSNGNLKDESSYLLRLEKLRKKEVALQLREQELNEWEHRLSSREKKIDLMEKTVKEKLQQGELYLKCCHENKSSCSSETSKYTARNRNDENCNANLDSTYISVGDSVILPTSKKLDVNAIVKPASFTRTMSERKIRFKGHSPLKDIDFNKRRSFKQSKKIKEPISTKTDWMTCSEDNDKSSVEGGRKSTNKKCKQLFPKPSTTYVNDDLRFNEEQCEPIRWTKESKKYAFSLLRMMNGDKENECEVKHTYL